MPDDKLDCLNRNIVISGKQIGWSAGSKAVVDNIKYFVTRISAALKTCALQRKVLVEIITAHNFASILTQFVLGQKIYHKIDGLDKVFFDKQLCSRFVLQMVFVTVFLNFGVKEMLNITERQTANATILTIEGNIIMGGGSKKLGQKVRSLIEAGRTNIVLNFSGVKYLDSSGVGELVSLSQMIDEADGNFRLSNLSSKVEDVLTLSSVLPLFEVYEDETEAANI